MPDAAGYRITFGVIVPSTNTVVEADDNLLSPYQPVADRQVTRFFEEAGFEVVRFKASAARRRPRSRRCPKLSSCPSSATS